MNIDKFETISIRGRLAFGATCFERALKQYNAITEKMNELLLAIWQFTSSERLDNWEQNMQQFFLMIVNYKNLVKNMVFPFCQRKNSGFYMN